MIGMRTGKASGVFVLDLDVDREKGLDGITAIAAYGRLPATVMALTPRGGRHCYFRHRSRASPTGEAICLPAAIFEGKAVM